MVKNNNNNKNGDMFLKNQFSLDYNYTMGHIYDIVAMHILLENMYSFYVA